MKNLYIIVSLSLFFGACTTRAPKQEVAEEVVPIEQKIAELVEVELKSDLSSLSDADKRALLSMMDAADVIDKIFWVESFGDKKVLDTISDIDMHDFVEMNYGPWERLNGNKPFVSGFGNKPLGANFYPHDIRRKEFGEFEDPDKASSYTMVRRDTSGNLYTIPYHVFFRKELEQVIRHLRGVLANTTHKELRHYLKLRIDALLTDDYFASEVAWLNASKSPIDIIIGPIENYEDELFGYKASHAALVLLRNEKLSDELEHINALIPIIHASLPCDEEVKQQVSQKASDAHMGIYDALYFKGENNTGGKAFAVNLPNDETIRRDYGTRKMFLRNVMEVKIEKIIKPIAELVIDKEQYKLVASEAFVNNAMYRELVQGMSVVETINGKGTVRSALKETFNEIEEARSEIGALYVAQQLHKIGELDEERLMSSYVTFLANNFRATRFGTSNAHARAGVLIFNYLSNMGAIEYTNAGRYRVNFYSMGNAVSMLLGEILTIQANGDYGEAIAWLMSNGNLENPLKSDLEKINQAKIPRDVRFNQGPEVLGLKRAPSK